MKKFWKSKSDSIESKATEIVSQIYDNKDKLIDIHDNTAKLAQEILDEKESLLSECIAHQLSLIFIKVGYDAEMISMLPIIKNENQVRSWEISQMYRKGTIEIMTANLISIQGKKEFLSNNEIKDLIDESGEIITSIINLYTSLEMIFNNS
jgi:hypothetical protein